MEVKAKKPNTHHAKRSTSGWEKGAAKRLGVPKRVQDSWARVSGLGRTDRQSVAERALAGVVGLEDEVTSAG